MSKILAWQKMLAGSPTYGLPRYWSDEKIGADLRLNKMLEECDENEQRQILTPDVSSYLIKNVLNFLGRVPEPFFLEDLVREHAEYCDLADVARRSRSYNICLMLIKGDNLNLVPRKHRSYELCRACIQQNIYAAAFNLIPTACLTKELCSEFLRNCKIAIRYNGTRIYADEISHRLFELDFCDETFLEHILCERIELFLSIPKLYLTNTLCTLAIDNNSRYVLHTPSILLNKSHFETFAENISTSMFVCEIIERFLMSECVTLKEIMNSIDGKYLDQQIFNIALDVSANNIYFIPDAYITDKMKAAVLSTVKVCQR